VALVDLLGLSSWRRGGWLGLCRTEQQWPPIWRRQFCR
jgi:hypothetical protein